MQIGWIDFAREDRAKAMGVLHLLQERIAVDGDFPVFLGVGMVFAILIMDSNNH